MPFALRERNALLDEVGRADLTAWLHTAAPSDAAPTNGRTSAGGGAYEAGLTIPVANIGDASAGSMTFTADAAFGTVAGANVGTVTHLSLLRGSDLVGWASLMTPTVLNVGDTGTIDMNTLDFTIT